jgi:predicted nucleic acid-binding protein
MNGYLLDTNVISEFSKKKPDERVRKWVDAQNEATLYLSVLTFGEIRKGITLLPEAEKRTKLENWLDTKLPGRFKGRLLPVTDGIAEIWGSMAAKAQMEGIALGAIDGLLGATAANHDLTVATRNAPDFRACNVPVINPWDF